MSRIQLSSTCRQCQSHFAARSTIISVSERVPPRKRMFSSYTPKRADDTEQLLPNNTSTSSQPDRSSDSSSLADLLSASEPAPAKTNETGTPTTRRPKAPARTFDSNLEQLATGARASADTRPGSGVSSDEPYHLNVYSHKHNMHITFTEPSRNPILSFSAGNIGLRKAQRGTFDAAYQLATYTMRKMAEKQWRTGGKNATMNSMLTLNDTSVRDRGIEIVMRGYGPGREAFQKALMGAEGKVVKPLVKKVTDSTRLKFGGTRSRAVRRLG